MKLEELTDALWARMQEEKPRALAVGTVTDSLQKYNYVNEKPYAAVVIGQLAAGRLLAMPDETVCEALLEGMPVYLQKQVFPGSGAPVLRRELSAAEQRLRRLGALPWDAPGELVTAEKARSLLRMGNRPAPGSRLTPLAREILEGRGL